MSNKKIVYLLGAGAMLDFDGPKTGTLSNECASIVKDCGFSGIIESLDKTYGEGCYNFETIIACIEYLMDWAIAKQTIGATVQNTNVIRAIFETQIKNIQTETIASLYKELINHLINKIMKYDFIKDEDPNQLLLNRYFSNVKKEHKVKIYSLNYDRLIPQLFDKIYDGTINSDQLYKTFSYDIRKFTKHKFTYFNLHGSIYLKQVPNRLYDVCQSILPEYIDNCLSQDGGSPNDLKIFSPIIAGYSKSQRILSEPFHLGYSSFCADCSDCEKLVIVGYSFSDPHINTILKKYVFERQAEIDIVDSGNDDEPIKNNITYRLKYSHWPYGTTRQNPALFTKGFIDYLTNAVEKNSY